MSSPAGYRAQSADTDPGVDREWFALLGAMSPRAKAQLISRLHRLADQLAMAGLRRRHPTATEHELRMRLGLQRLGPELMRRAYGWPPEAAGA